MAKRQPKKTPSHNPYDWENNETYPEKKDLCAFCGQTDLVKLSFDHIRFICKNAHACVLRWRKDRIQEDV